MITQLSSGGREWRAINYHPAALERRWLERASTAEGAGPPIKEIKDIDGPDKNESRSPRILVVDDDESGGRMLERVIVRLTGYDCSYVKDANKAIEVLEKGVVDVVVTDIRMPDMSGLELSRIIKAKFDSDVIVITGYYQDFTYEDAFDHGASDFIEKPVQPKELIIRLERVLRERESAARCRQAEENLRKINSELEKRIEERYGELQRINALLQAEINERRHAEEEWREFENRYRLAADAAHEGIWDMDLISKTVRCNKTFSDQFGAPPEAGLSWQWWIDRIHPEESDRTIAGFTAALKGTGSSWNQEYRFLRPDGAYAHVFNRAYIERDKAGRATKVYGAMLDMTPLRQIEIELKKRTEQLEQANKELESFSYSVSHDLREPLRIIDGFSHMLLKDLNDKINESTRRKIDVIRGKANLMNQLIENVLTFSRLGSQALTITSIDLEKLTTEVWTELQENSPERNVSINISKLNSCQGDYHMIRQVLVNLLSNALKFTINKEPVIIEVAGYETANECVYYVKDNGAGFDMRFAEKLFRLFQRLHSEEEYKGTGVGLSFIKRIIERHGGRVWAEGEVDEGATFYFALPKQVQQVMH